MATTGKTQGERLEELEKTVRAMEVRLEVIQLQVSQADLPNLGKEFEVLKDQHRRIEQDLTQFKLAELNQRIKTLEDREKIRESKEWDWLKILVGGGMSLLLVAIGFFLNLIVNYFKR